jgi:hypothetical protein
MLDGWDWVNLPNLFYFTDKGGFISHVSTATNLQIITHNYSFRGG